VADDGLIVLIDGVVLVDDWTQHSIRTYRVTTNVVAGPHVVTVLFNNINGYAVLRLSIFDALDNGFQPALTPTGQLISTLATSANNQGNGGNQGGPASLPPELQLDGFSGLAVATNGDVYISSALNHVVVRLRNGVPTAIAGTGSPGYSGEGGTATNAKLNSPKGIALYQNGTDQKLYIADSGNNRVRVVDLVTGAISLYAGNGSSGFTGDGGPPTAASFTDVSDVAVDGSGYVYIADTGNHRVRHTYWNIVSTRLEIDSPIGGTSTASTSGDPGTAFKLVDPVGLAMRTGPNPRLYIADSGLNQILDYGPGSSVYAIAGGSSADASSVTDSHFGELSQVIAPSDVAVDANGDVLFVEANGSLIRRWIASTGQLQTVAGRRGISRATGDNGTALNATIDTAQHLAAGSSYILVASNGANPSIRRIG
jgi:trimeric autotransporter adhesin